MSKMIKISTLFLSLWDQPYVAFGSEQCNVLGVQVYSKTASPTFKLEEELQKEANRINRFIAF